METVETERPTCWLGRDDNRVRYFVEDAVAPLEIRVRRSDYKNGDCASASSCALSRALKRQNREVKYAFTGLSFAYVVYADQPTTAVRYSVPAAQRDAIAAFDVTGYLAPGEYRFNVVAPSQRLGYKKGKNGSTTRRGVANNVRHMRPAIERVVPTRRVNARQLPETPGTTVT